MARRHSRAWHEMHDGPLADRLARRRPPEVVRPAPVDEVRRLSQLDRTARHQQMSLNFRLTGDRE